MTKSASEESKSKSVVRDGAPLRAFLRKRWAGILVSAIAGFLFMLFLQSPPSDHDEPVLQGQSSLTTLANHLVDKLGVVHEWLRPIAQHHPELTWNFLAVILFFISMGIDWVFERLTENNYKTVLIGRYLRRRRIAWVSLIAVMLCTYMVLVVISVMGGWLNMARSSFRGLTGDIVIEGRSLKGFPYYEQIIDAIKKDPSCEVEAAIPSIETGGLINFGAGPKFAQVMGMPIEDMDQVNHKFGESLFNQHQKIADELKTPGLTPEKRAWLERKLHEPPSFDLQNDVTEPLEAKPADLPYAAVDDADVPRGVIELPADFPAALRGRLRYDARRHNLVFNAKMRPQWQGFLKMAVPDAMLEAMGTKIGTEWKQKLQSLSPDPNYKKAVEALYSDSQQSFFYNAFTGQYRGLIVGTGVVGVHRDQDWKWIHPPGEFKQQTTLTLLDLSGERVTAENVVFRNFFIVDDSHLGVWQYDQNYVYVAFDKLQKDLNMAARQVNVDNMDVIEPARVTHIHIRVRVNDPNDEARLEEIRDRIAMVTRAAMQTELNQHGYSGERVEVPIIETWQEQRRTWLAAIENEKSMLEILFGIISIVAVFLIFCIFYMIVAEKTKDIGIIKSEGATSVGVAAIFLGYGLVIGIIGGFLGLVLSYVTIDHINELHTFLSQKLHATVWNPEVYVFDKIPSTMSETDIAVILPIAVLASVVGALVPAIRAARMNPVEALRWE